jgi:hypothetical protein
MVFGLKKFPPDQKCLKSGFAGQSGRWPARTFRMKVSTPESKRKRGNQKANAPVKILSIERKKIQFSGKGQREK